MDANGIARQITDLREAVFTVARTLADAPLVEAWTSQLEAATQFDPQIVETLSDILPSASATSRERFVA